MADSKFELIKLPSAHRHGQPGLYSLADLPQSKPISDEAMSPGWWELEQIWKIYPGQFTIVTGIAGHGKSTFLLNVICNLAKQYGVRSFLYVPENEPQLHAKLGLMWGKPKSDKDLTFKGFCERHCFIQSARPDHFETAPQDLSWVLNHAIATIESDHVDVLLIDPWNELERAKPRDMMMTDYIGQCLMWLKQFCRAWQVAIILVAHPTKAVAEHGGRAPLLSDIEGSMNWYNKCDNGLVVVRDFKANTCQVISAKVRELGAGKIGACHFFVDEQTGVFVPQHGAVS